MAGIQTIALQATTAGDVEMPILSQQILEEPQVHFVWLEMAADATPRTRRGADHNPLEFRQRAWARPRDDPCSQSETREACGSDVGLSPCETSERRHEFWLKWRSKYRSCSRRWRKLGKRLRQTAVQDTSLFEDAEVLVEAPKIPPQPHGLDPRTREALTRMTDALNNMQAQQQQQPLQAQIPRQPPTPTVTQGTEPFKELPVTQEGGLRAGNSTSRQFGERTRPGDKPAQEQEDEDPYEGGATGRASERPRRAVDWNGRGSEEQIHPGSQREVCSLLIKKKQSHDENRQAEVRTKKHCRIGEAMNPAPNDKKRSCPVCGAQSQLQTRGSKCSLCETAAVVVWKCSTFSDGIRKQGILLCEDCLGRDTLTTGGEIVATGKDAGAQGQGLVLGVQVLHVLRVTSGGAAIVPNRSSRRARRQDHTFCQYANKSLMDPHVRGMPASSLRGLSRQGNWQGTRAESDWTDRAITGT